MAVGELVGLLVEVEVLPIVAVRVTLWVDEGVGVKDLVGVREGVKVGVNVGVEATAEGVGVIGAVPERQTSLIHKLQVVGPSWVSHWSATTWVKAMAWVTVVPPLLWGAQSPDPPHQSWNSIPAMGME